MIERDMDYKASDDIYCEITYCTGRFRIQFTFCVLALNITRNEDEHERTYPVVNVSAVLADPFSCPILVVFLYCFGGLAFFVSKDV
jgi:hypothetical protein